METKKGLSLPTALGVTRICVRRLRQQESTAREFPTRAHPESMMMVRERARSMPDVGRTELENHLRGLYAG